jgi:hypothetical protein
MKALSASGSRDLWETLAGAALDRLSAPRSRASSQVAALAGTALSSVLLGLLARPRRPSPLRAGLAQALGAAAVGALAVGAVSIGALAISRLKVKTLRISRLEIDHLEVRSGTGVPGAGGSTPSSG